MRRAANRPIKFRSFEPYLEDADGKMRDALPIVECRASWNARSRGGAHFEERQGMRELRIGNELQAWGAEAARKSGCR